jgi:hypothetical protein
VCTMYQYVSPENQNLICAFQVGRTILNDETGRTRIVAVMASRKYYSKICLESPDKIHESWWEFSFPLRRIWKGSSGILRHVVVYELIVVLKVLTASISRTISRLVTNQPNIKINKGGVSCETPLVVNVLIGWFVACLTGLPGNEDGSTFETSVNFHETTCHKISEYGLLRLQPSSQ